MKPYRYLSSVEQLAEHLRGEILRGDLSGAMPGIDKLAGTLGCSQRTVIGAVKQLEQEGILLMQGAGRASKIRSQDGAAKPTLKIRMMLYDREDSDSDAVNPYLTEIRSHLENAGHTISFASRTLRQLGMEKSRVARYVGSEDADAWVVASASREVLKWFSEQPKPAFALFGRRHGLPIAGIGPDKAGSFKATTRQLIGLGHRRIVLLVRPARRLPEPGLPERTFLEELTHAGIKTGSYNLPDWDGTTEGLHKTLDMTFRHTPPTAVIIDEPPIFLSVQHYLARRGILAPEHVSLVCADQDNYFDYMRPLVTHIRYDTAPWARRIAKWAHNIAMGKDDRRQSLTKAKLVMAGTIGPAAKRP